MDSSSFSSSTSSKIFSSRLFKVSSCSLSRNYCARVNSVTTTRNWWLNPQLARGVFLTCARWPPRIFLCFLSTSAIIVPKSGVKDHVMKLFRVPSYNNWLKWFRPNSRVQSINATKTCTQKKRSRKITSRDHVTNNQKSLSTERGPLNSAQCLKVPI